MSRFPKSLHPTQPLKEQAYQLLRKAILSGDLAPGQRLVEAHLARDLQISRTPIREALNQLQREALIVSDVDNRLRVTTFSIEDAVHLYECRSALERVSVVAACHQATKSQLRKLQQLVKQAEKLAENKASQMLNFQILDLDYQFHRLLAGMSGNPWLEIMLDQVFDKMMLLRIQTIQQNQDVVEIRAEHHSIYEAVAQRDPDAALAALQDHLDAARIRVVDELKIFHEAQVKQ